MAWRRRRCGGVVGRPCPPPRSFSTYGREGAIFHLLLLSRIFLSRLPLSFRSQKRGRERYLNGGKNPPFSRLSPFRFGLGDSPNVYLPPSMHKGEHVWLQNLFSRFFAFPINFHATIVLYSSLEGPLLLFPSLFPGGHSAGLAPRPLRRPLSEGASAPRHISTNPPPHLFCLAPPPPLHTETQGFPNNKTLFSKTNTMVQINFSGNSMSATTLARWKNRRIIIIPLARIAPPPAMHASIISGDWRLGWFAPDGPKGGGGRETGSDGLTDASFPLQLSASLLP